MFSLQIGRSIVPWFALMLSLSCGRIDYDLAASETAGVEPELPQKECITEQDCIDGNECTDDACIAGDCVWTDNSLACDDGDLCSSEDTCTAGVCVGASYTCEDNDNSTVDVCDGDGSCSFDTIAPVALAEQGREVNTIGADGQTIAVNGTMAYLGLAGDARGMQIFDLADPTNPVALGVFRTDLGDAASLSTWANEVLGIEVVGNRAYLTTYYGGLVIVDVSDPSVPTYLGSLALPNECWALAVSGNYAFVANTGDLGIVVVDVSNAFMPVQVANIDLGRDSLDVHLDGDRLYVASSSHFDVVDVSTPTSPQLLGSVVAGEDLYGVWAPPGGPAYVVDNAAMQLLTFDVSASSPTLVHATAPGTVSYRSVVGVAGNLFVGIGNNREPGEVLSYSLQTANMPVLTARAPSADAVYEVAVLGDVVTVATLDGAVQSYRAVPVP